MTEIRSGGRGIAPPLVALIALAALAGLPGLAAGPWRVHAAAVERADSRIAIRNFAFSPPTVTVPAGATLTWVNDDEEPHTVTATDGSFRSPGLDHAETFAHRFERPGTYRYFCALHPHMRATVVVR